MLTLELFRKGPAWGDEGRGGGGGSDDSHTSTNDVGNLGPVSRDQASNGNFNRQEGTLVSGPGENKTNEVGVGTNIFGVPQYDYSEVGDGKGGYDAYYQANPSSTISGKQAAIQKGIAKGLGLLGAAPMGLGLRGLTALQEKGIIGAADFKALTAGGANGNAVPEEGEHDARIQQILDDDSLTDDEKQQQVSDVLGGAAKDAVTEEWQQETFDRVKSWSDMARSDSSVDPVSVLTNPEYFMNGGMLSDRVPDMDPNAPGTVIDPNDPRYQMDPSRFSYEAATGQASQAGTVTPQQAQGYDAALTLEDILANGQATAAQGEVSDEAQVTAEQHDMQGVATGTNADGTVNHTGQALNDVATQNISSVIDTSTVAGKLLAQELGEGNYTDAKATVQGQMEILSKHFVDSQGNPTIPSWAAGIARNVSRIAAFSGMTGTAATAAMSQALMEASLPIAQQDAQFFQTVTMKNLDNRHQMTVNKANVLSKMEMANLDARMQAAVVNAQHFMQMDMANLNNEQQAEIVNTQARIQSILEDAKAKNAERMFTADAANDFTKFYDQLNTQIETFNAEQRNAMERFNVGEVNSAAQFNANLESQREQFYKEMQYNIDMSNVRWRQTVETVETQMHFEAAQRDIQNMFSLTTEAMNQMWDREDAILDYTFRAAESQLQRDVERYAADRGYDIQNRKLDQQADAAQGAAWYEVITQGVSTIDTVMSWF